MVFKLARPGGSSPTSVSSPKTPSRPILEELGRRGFVRLPNSPFAPADVEALNAACAHLTAGQLQLFKDRIGCDDLQDDTNHAILNNILGVAPELDRLLEQLLADPLVERTLSGVLGSGYKLGDVRLRRAKPGGSGLRMHQDDTGETSVVILVNDSPTSDGCTAFWPGTHRCPFKMDRMIPTCYPTMLRWATRGTVGRAGDTYIFFNRTWHGRFANAATTPVDAILMSFFPANAVHASPRISPAALENLGLRLRGLLETSSSAEEVGNERLPDEFRTILTGEVPVFMFSWWPLLRACGSVMLAINKIRLWIKFAGRTNYPA